MMPRTLRRLLFTRGDDVSRRRRPRAPTIRYELEPGAVHDSQGHFLSEDPPLPPSAGPPALVQGPALSARLADETRALAEAGNADVDAPPQAPSTQRAAR